LAAVVSTIVMIWAVFVVVIFKPQRLSNQEKATISAVDTVVAN
jgi:hypothetical protein